MIFVGANLHDERMRTLVLAAMRDETRHDDGVRRGLAHPPGHHFVEVSVGLWMTNCSVDGSYVAVVSSPRMYVPCPSSVCAYVPMIFNATQRGIQNFFCSSSAWPWMVGMNMPKCRSSPPGSSIISRITRPIAIGSPTPAR